MSTIRIVSGQLGTAGMTAEVASNAGNLLSDIKPGYMLGAKPRQQASGAVVVTDRFADSSVAYQGAGRGLDRADSETVARAILAQTVTWPLPTRLRAAPERGRRAERGRDCHGFG